MKLKKGQRLEVYWEDSAHAPAGWHELDDTIRTALVSSLGYVHEVKPGYVVMVAEIATSKQVAHLTAIPKSAIRKVRRI